jgi:hypothetical protein
MMRRNLFWLSDEVILEALQTFGRDGRGKDGIIGLIHRAIRADVKHAITLLTAITPKLLEANIVRTEVTYRTIAELDAGLAQLGLPRTAAIFDLDYSTGQDEESEPIEAEIVKG